MRYTVSFILLSILFAFSGQAHNYHVNDTLYVVAESGLNMREDANLKSKVRKKLEKGEAIRILNTFEFSLKRDTIENLQGSWVFIETLNDGQKGYVFDGFLSRFPILPTLNTYGLPFNNETIWPFLLRDYVVRAFPENKEKIDYSLGGGIDDHHMVETRFLKNDYKLMKHTSYGGSGFELELDEARQAEVYFLIRHIMSPVPEGTYGYDPEVFKQPLTRNGNCQVLNERGDCLIQVREKAFGNVSVFFYFD